MSKLFATSNELGYFDFYSNLIEVRRYTKSAKRTLEEALAELPSAKWDEYWSVRVNFRSLVAHEATHFNDCLTTTWGMEFLYRKLRLMKCIAEEKDTEQPLSVFYLNVAELKSHEELLVIGEHPLSLATSMTHTVTVDERFGPLIYINYNIHNKIIQKVPLSLLAVIEAHALANETLVKIVSAEALSDCPEKTEYITKIHTDFDTALSDNTQSEYTVLLTLSRLHFKELSLKELLIFVATLCRFALDLNDIACSKISYHIQDSIKDQYAGETICQDMRRGSSRAVIFFKTILFMHGWIKLSNYSTRTNAIRLLKANPLAAIIKFWGCIDNDFPMIYKFGDQFLFEGSLNCIGKLASVIDKEIIKSCSLHNRSVLNNRPLGLCKISDLRLPDIFLSDETEIGVPNRIDLSISDYFIDNMDVFTKTEEHCKKSVQKFFMRPGDPIVNINPFTMPVHLND